MKEHISVILLLCFFFILSEACTTKALPEITSRTTEPFKKEKVTKVIKADLLVGKTIFINRCGKCHDLPVSEQYTATRWEGILSYMIPRARLNDEEGIHVTAYLKANALNRIL